MTSISMQHDNPSRQHRILIVDDDPDIRGALTDTIDIFDEYINRSAANAKEALLILDDFKPDLVLLDINLGSSNGLDLLPVIKQTSPDTIVIIMTAYRDNQYTIKALKNGADDYLLKPLDIELLLPQLESFLVKRQSDIKNQKLINNLQLMLEQTNKLLFLLDHNGNLLETTNTALQLIGCQNHDVIGLHFQDTPWWAASPAASESIKNAVNMAKGGQQTQMELCTTINDKDMYIDVTIKPVTDSDYATKFIIVDSHDITVRKEMEESLRVMAQHDPLTGLANRGLFDEHLKISIAQATRRQGRFAILFIDLDNFKLLNDSFGHDAGDEFLISASTAMDRVLRNSDILARFGGDEFAVILTDIPSDFDPKITARRILDSIRTLPLPASANFTVTASIGIAIYPEHSIDHGQLLKMADIAMYQAKQAGKNTIKQHTTVG